MRKESFFFLLAGFSIGFGILYFSMKDRATQMVSQIPVLTSSPQQVSAASEPPPPPIDMARMQQLQAALKANPQDFDALREMGNVSFDQRNFKDATSWYSRALALQPNNLDLRTDLATAMYYSDDFEGSVAELKKVLAVQPGHPPALFNLGVAYIHSRDLKSALETWEKLVALNPNYPQLDIVKQEIEGLKRQMGVQP